MLVLTLTHVPTYSFNFRSVEGYQMILNTVIKKGAVVVTDGKTHKLLSTKSGFPMRHWTGRDPIMWDISYEDYFIFG